MLTVQSYSMDADSESVQGIKTMNRQEKEDQAQIEYRKAEKESEDEMGARAPGTSHLCVGI